MPLIDLLECVCKCVFMFVCVFVLLIRTERLIGKQEKENKEKKIEKIEKNSGTKIAYA